MPPSTWPLAFVAVIACVSVVVAGIFRGRAAGRPSEREFMKRILDRLDAIVGRETAGASLADTRLDRLEHAIEAIAVEVERIGEGQRFVTKVLADRSPGQQRTDASVQRGRVITPH